MYIQRSRAKVDFFLPFVTSKCIFFSFLHVKEPRWREGEGFESGRSGETKPQQGAARGME